MKLPQTEKYIKDGIKMQKELSTGFFGTTYDRKTVYDLEKAIDLNANEGWYFENYENTFGNLALFLWRDLLSQEKDLPVEGGE